MFAKTNTSYNSGQLSPDKTWRSVDAWRRLSNMLHVHLWRRLMCVTLTAVADWVGRLQVSAVPYTVTTTTDN